MPIIAPTPTDVPASEAKVYDKYWMKHFSIMANDPSGKIVVTAILHKARDTGNGVYELSPVDTDVIIRVNDFGAAAVADPSLVTLQNMLLDKISAIALAQGKL